MDLDIEGLQDITTERGKVPKNRFTPEAEAIAKDMHDILDRMKASGVRSFSLIWLPLKEPVLAGMVGVDSRNGKDVGPLDVINEQPMMLINMGADRAAPLMHYVTDICERVYHAAAEKSIDGAVMEALAMFNITREQFGAKLDEQEKLAKAPVGRSA